MLFILVGGSVGEVLTGHMSPVVNNQDAYDNKNCNTDSKKERKDGFGNSFTGSAPFEECNETFLSESRNVETHET